MKTIFISSTFRDMHHERDAIKELVEPQINNYAGPYGEEILLKDLRWGINIQEIDESQVEIETLRSCLEEIDDSRPYMVILLGDRYGWIPTEEHIRNAVEVYEGFIEEDLHKSITELEIEYGALKRAHWRGKEKPKALFYFRKMEGDFPEEYQTSNEKERESLERLKERIRKEFGPEQVHEYCLEFENKEPKRQSLNAFAEKVREDIQALFQEEWEENKKKSETERDLSR